MRILLRADASRTQGTGHVMRCLTLAEAFTARGHYVTLMGNLGEVPWLREALARSAVQHLECAPDELDVDWIVGLDVDGAVVDSYRIPSELISQLNERIPCLAIIDGNARGIDASLYLDQNLGAVHADRTVDETRLLAGNQFVLVRDAVLEQRRGLSVAEIKGRAHVVAFMGGTDPHGTIVEVAKSIVAQDLNVELTLVSPPQWIPAADAALAHRAHTRIIEPTFKLPAILGGADIIVSAAGTSAWDVCTMARPAVLVAVVDNQRNSLAPIARERVALNLDVTSDGSGSVRDLGPLVASLVGSLELRRSLVARCLDVFDGQGKVRVAEAAEKIWSGSHRT